MRVGKKLLFQQSRYAHAKQFKRARRATRKLRTILGRVLRDIERKAPQPSEEMAELLALGQRLYQQKRTDKNKLYSIHAPEVACIAKGKARKRYEFGCKVSLGVTSRGGWFVAARACPGNPYDGHTLKGTLEQLERVAGRNPEHVFVDMGYRGHDYDGDSIEVHVDRRRRGRIPRSLWRWMKRRAAIEPSIGHLKSGKRLDRNRLKGTDGDKLNVPLSASGMNFAKLLSGLRQTAALLSQILVRLLEALKPPASRDNQP